MQADTRAIVVMPAFNEAVNIAKTIANIASLTSLPIVVVDDASTDATAAIARASGARVLPLASQLGAWGATQTGIRYALKHGFQRTVTIDADGQHDAAGISALLEYQEKEGAALVIGSCPSRGSRARRIAWMLFRVISGLPLQDLTSGFRAYSRTGMEIVASPQASNLDYQDIGILLLLRQARMKVVEKSVCMNSRPDGKSRIFNSWYSVAMYMAYSIILSLSHNGMTRRQ
ncbi:MAG: glycosyltransferase family 2 protein [Pseudodesulfovibrio sp.]